MQHKILINHCVAVLGQHHDFAQTPSSITVSYTSEPIETITNIHKIVDEDDILQSYFKTQNVRVLNSARATHTHIRKYSPPIL